MRRRSDGSEVRHSTGHSTGRRGCLCWMWGGCNAAERLMRSGFYLAARLHACGTSYPRCRPVDAAEQQRCGVRRGGDVRACMHAGPEDSALVSETIDLSSYPIDSSYDGPRMACKEVAPAPADGGTVMASSGDDTTEQYVVTQEFVEGMMAHFKAQKKIPLRFILQILLDFQVRDPRAGVPTRMQLMQVEPDIMSNCLQ